MPNGWQTAHAQLGRFIAEHPEIGIKPDSVRLPDSVRPEFYRLFDAARTAFVAERFPSLLDEADVLSRNYLEAERGVITLLGLEDISMEPDLGRFLHNPLGQLIRVFFDTFFDFLKGRMDTGQFELAASQDTQAYFSLLYRLGYEKWVVLSLARLLGADRLFQISLEELNPKERHLGMTGPIMRESPSPEESRHLLFNYEPEAIFAVPDMIVHSSQADRYIASRSGLVKILGGATNASTKREWYPLDSVGVLEPGLTLVYVDDKLEEISLVADAERICRPDLILQCRGDGDWFEKEGLERIKLSHHSLKPVLGTYIISRYATPENLPDSLDPEMHILSIGFEQDRLAPVVEAITETNRTKG